MLYTGYRVGIFGVLFSVLSIQSSLASTECDSYKKEYQKIQLTQQGSHPINERIVLHNQAQAAWETWMSCAKSGEQHDESLVNIETTADIAITEGHECKHDIVSTRSTFDNDNPIIIKASYQGDKQLAWLNFYKRNEVCFTPENTQVLAFCLADKKRQKDNFDKEFINI